MRAEKILYIGIHPWGPEDPPDYALKRDQRLNNPNLDQILLVESDLYIETVKRCCLYGDSWRERLFLSPPETGLPSSGMLYFASELKRVFPAEKYILWGAMVEIEDEKVVGGCLGHFYNRMKAYFPTQTEIDMPYCFVFDWENMLK